MGLHREAFVGFERTRLVQDVVRQCRLADIVQWRAVFERTEKNRIDDWRESRSARGLLRQHAAISLKPQEVRVTLRGAVLDELRQSQYQAIASADEFAVAILDRLFQFTIQREQLPVEYV